MVLPGERFGNYEICAHADGSVATLGSGAGGTTVRAVHVHLGTQAAIKFLRRRGTHPARESADFLTEARAAAGLSHPHIARIHDFGEGAGRLYYVMEFCEGGSLEKRLASEGPLDSASALEWLRQAASALAYAHRQGFLHRDIKPSNLLLANERETASLKLIDFGLAARSDDENEAGNRVIGTPLYAAPEQLRGDACAASDVFSLGATFLHLLAGRTLAEGDVKTVIGERLSSTGYGHSLQGLDPSWTTLLAALLEIDPARRPADGAAVVTWIEEIFAGVPSRPVPWAEVSEESAPSRRRSPLEAWEDRGEAPWQQSWQLLGAGTPAGAGRRASARREGTEEIRELTLFENPAEALLAALIPQGTRLQSHAAELGLGEVLLQRGAGWYAIAWSAFQGTDAISWIRHHPEPPMETVLAMLRPLAGGLDGIAGDGFEHLELHPSMLRIADGPAEPGTVPFVSLDLDLPVSETHNRIESGMTLGGMTAASLPARFAACLYHFLGGRPVPPAAFVNVRAYAAIPRLSERANRFLSQLIAGQSTVSHFRCSDVVEMVANDERLPGSTIHSSASLPGVSHLTVNRPAAASHTASARSSLPVAPPPSPPPSLPPPVSSVPPPPPVPVSPPPVAPVLPAAPAPIPASAPAPAPPPAPAVVPPIAPRTARSRGPLPWVVATAVIVVLAGAGAAAWRFLPRHAPEPVVPPQVAVTPPGTAPAQSDPPPPPVHSNPPPASGTKMSRVRVPEDAATLAAAIEKCADGGELEINGGVFRESLLLTRSLSIRASGGAVIEDGGSHACLLTAKGKAKVTVKGLIFRNAEKEASGDPNDHAPLVLAASGAEIVLEQCVLDGGMGDGFSLVDKAVGTLDGCRVLRNRGFGLRIVGGSSASVSSGSVQENGLGGVMVANAGSRFQASNSCAISRNPNNGIQAIEGATIDLSGVELSSNGQNGVLAMNPGTTVTLRDSTAVSENNGNGMYVGIGAAATVSSGKFERNKSHGVVTERAGALDISKSVFANNARVGVFFNQGGQSKCRIVECEFQNHAEFGVAFAGGVATVTGNSFSGNGTAILAGEGTSGEIRSNTLTPGPLEEALLLEEGSSVTASENTVN